MTCRPSDGGSILFLMWLVCVVLVFVTLDSTADAATAKIPLALMKGDATDIINTAYINGAKAAFQGEGNTLHNGAALSLQPLVTSMNLVETIATMSADTIFFGIDDEEVLAAVVHRTLSDPRLFFAPYTTTDTLRRWNESIFFTRTDPTTELLALLGYLVANDAPRKVGFMLLYDSGLGLKEWNALNTQLNLMGSSSWSSLYNASMREDVVDPTSFQNFITSKPQAVFVFGVPCPHTTNFFTQIITNPVMVGANIPILMPMALLESLSTAYVTTLASPTSGHDILPASNIFFSSTNPISTDTRFAAVSSFTTEMTATTGAAAFDELTEVELTYSMAGWVSGKVLLSALNLYGYETPFSGPDFLSKVFQQSRYIVGGDFIVGNYGGAATPLVVSQGGIQECNQGGHLVTVNSLSVSIPDGGAQAALATPLKMVQLTNLPAYDFVYPLTQCYAQTWSMIYPVNLLLLNLTDGPSDGYIADRMVALQNTLPSSGSQPTLQMLPSVASIATSNVVVNETSNSFNRIMLSGILPRSVSVGHLFVLDPIDFPTGLRRLEPNVIYLSATLEQQLFVLANYIGTATPANTRVHAVIRRRTGASAITSLLENSLRTFRRSLDSSITDLSSSSSLVSHLSFTGINIAVGLRTVDIDDLATFLSEHTQAVVAVAFQDFTMLYESFWEVFSTQPASVQDRLIFATNLPSWTGVFPTGVSASPSIDAFLSSGGPSVHNPASVQTFIMSKTVASLVKNLGRLTPSALEIALYNRVTFPVAMLPFGNYQNNCTTANNLNSDCLFNYGAQRIAVWSFRTITSGALLMQPVTPTMLYSISTPPKHNHLLIIILASVFGGVCVLGLLFVLLWCCLTSVETRDNRHAPKDGAVPVTLIFTDIESSTALWATVPEEMSDAVQLHHRLIRGLIAKYRCYEVKTIGDAFMISSSNAYACVRLARDLQVVFKRCNWGSQAIDEAYRSFHQAKGQHVERDEVAYSRAWNGLRVRVGIHTGLCTIRYDEVTKGFDYYGETPNIAARVESLGVGGQVLLTEQAVNSLTDEQLMGLPLERLGPNKLRGLSQIVVIHQLNAIEARNFSSAVMSRLQAAERAAEAGEVEEHGSGNLQDLYALMEAQPSDEEDETDERRANEEVLANDLFAVYHSPFRQQERRRLLERSCQRFGLFGQHRMYYASDEEYHRALIHSLATRASSIVRYNRRQRPAFSAFEWRPRTSSPLAGLRRRNSARRLVARVSSREDFVTNDTTRDPSSTPLDDQESGAFGPNPMSPLSVREGKLLSFSKSEPSDLANNFLSSTTMGSYEASDERAASPRTVGSPRLNHDDSCVMRGGGESGAYVPLPVLGQVVREGTSQALDFPGSHLQSPLTAESVWPAHFEQLFRHGRPTFVGDTVVSCFSAGDGMLFRICDSHTSRWAFYNDSPHYTVRIKFSMGRKSRIVALGNTHLERNPETQRMEGTVVVSPLSTEMLVAGFVNGYIMRYNMVIVND